VVPYVSGIVVTLTRLITQTVTLCLRDALPIYTGNVATTLTSLTRSAGETLSGSPYSITAATFNALTGSAAGNYSAPTFTGAPALTINAPSLTAATRHQSKTYGSDDPSLSGIAV